MLLLDILNCLLFGQIDFMQLPLMDINMLLWHSGYQNDAFPGINDISSSVAEALLERIVLTWGLLSNIRVTQEPILLARHFNMSLLSGQFYNSFTVFTILDPPVQQSTLMALLRLNWQNLQRTFKQLAKKHCHLSF